MALLGNTACNALQDTKIKITDVHRVVITEDERTYFITFHPAYALGFPEGKKGFLEDFEELKRCKNLVRSLAFLGVIFLFILLFLAPSGFLYIFWS